MKKAVSAFLFSLLVSAGVGQAQTDVPGPVVSLLQKRCAFCHKGKKPSMGLSLEPGNIIRALDAASQEMPELKIIDTASPASSYILKKIRREEGIKGKPMPPLRALEAGELEVLEKWVLGMKGFPPPASAAGSPDGRATGPTAAAQDPAPSRRPFDTPAFFGTRLINLPTTATPDRGDVLLLIAHRFSEPVETGFDNLFGLDSYANILFGLGYGLTDHLTVSVGRARTYREFELAADWLVAEQGVTAGLPFSAALHGGVSLATAESPDEVKLFAALSLSRQITRRLSVLIVPALVTNADHWALEPESTFSLGVGARYMVFRDFSVSVEWTPVLAGYAEIESGWALGLEKKIGGHVFQAFVTNALGLTPAQVLPGGDLRLGDFDFRIGFNIFRTF